MQFKPSPKLDAEDATPWFDTDEIFRKLMLYGHCIVDYDIDPPLTPKLGDFNREEFVN